MAADDRNRIEDVRDCEDLAETNGDTYNREEIGLHRYP
jgi:hypothetical protein